MEPMEGRWVCRRCFASNESDAAACVQCGLERGAEPVEGDQQQSQWVAPTPAASTRPMWQQLVLRFWWIGLIVVVAAAGWYFSARRDDSGQIANAGDLQVQDLRIGDCFDLQDPDAESVEKVDAKPCNQPHQYEMFHIANMPAGDYPADASISAFLESECLPAFRSWVGMEYQASVIEVVYFTPTSDGWNDGDRSVQCAAYDPNDLTLAKSLRNANR